MKEGRERNTMKRNVIVGQSGGPTSVINSSLAGVYKNAKERGFHKVYGMLHGIQGLLDEKYVDTIIRRWESFTGKKAVHVSTGKTFAEIAAERK